jgi:signal transduction histidine kinase
MRLLTKTTLYFLAALIPLLVATGFFLYSQFSRELNQRMDEELVTEEIQWIRYLRAETANGASFILRTPEILISPVNAAVTKFPTIETTTGLDAKENRQLPFRQLTHVVPIDGTPYLISIRRSQEQRTVLVANITRIMLLVFITLFIITLFVNWLISRTIWTPFRKSLQKIRNAELQKMEAVHFDETNIKEFNDLNNSLNVMAGRINSDYVSMKEFTENAAHEMQTPLAVVQSKLELLLQDTNLKDDQVDSIVQASDALNRLRKLNQSLLLLAKIENNQYETNEAIDLTEVTKKYLRLFDEMIKDKQLLVETNFRGALNINLHPLLADSLVSNLVGNAIKYNFLQGKIFISIEKNTFKIRNTTDLEPIDKELIFKRFNKSKAANSTSNGLGLAIVKKICDTHHLKIVYEAIDNTYTFTISKPLEVGLAQ